MKSLYEKIYLLYTYIKSLKILSLIAGLSETYRNMFIASRLIIPMNIVVCTHCPQYLGLPTVLPKSDTPVKLIFA